MSQRKPGGQSWESFVDRQIREAQERGEFDDLPGAGKPLPDLDAPRDELWWVRKKLAAEELSYLPPSLELRRARETAQAEIAAAGDERTVREVVAELDARIRAANRTALDGPASTLMPLDEDEVVRDWRARRAAGDPSAEGRSER